MAVVAADSPSAGTVAVCEPDASWETAFPSITALLTTAIVCRESQVWNGDDVDWRRYWAIVRAMHPACAYWRRFDEAARSEHLN